MIAKVMNTGGDVAGNQFNLMIPSGGVGMFSACSRQWGTNDKGCVWQECMKDPAGSARDGCFWVGAVDILPLLGRSAEFSRLLFTLL